MQTGYSRDEIHSGAQRDCLQPASWEIISIAGLLLTYLLVGSWADPQGGSQSQFFGPIWLALTLLLGALRMVAIDKAALWCSLFWFRLSSAFYFGLGSVAYIFFNDYTTERVMAFYFASDAEMIKLNIINASAIFLVLGTTWFATRFFPASRTKYNVTFDPGFTLSVALIFLGIGYGIKYLIIVPNALGLFQTTFTGATSFFVWLAPCGLFIFTTWTLRHSFASFKFAAAFVGFDIIIGLLLFSKSEVILPLLMFVLAILFHRPTKTRLFGLALVVLLTFNYIEPIIGYGRNEIVRQHGVLQAANLSQRFAILSSYFSNKDFLVAEDDFQGSLVRFSYIHSAAPAIAQYDSGQPGNSLEYALYVFIPRLLWPDKPIFSMGANYTRLIDGTDTSSTWMGFFAESYWNFGWLGLPLVMIPLAFIYVGSSRYALHLISSGSWMHLPVAFLGIWMGMRTDGVIVTDIISSVFVMIIFYFIGTFTSASLRGLLLNRKFSNHP